MLVAGVDEVGRGALLGMVAAGAVILDPASEQYLKSLGVTDSKQLTAPRRQELAQIIRSVALECQIGWAEVAEIDQLNILQASLLAMERAIAASGSEAAGESPVGPGFVSARPAHDPLTGELVSPAQAAAHPLRIAFPTDAASGRTLALLALVDVLGNDPLADQVELLATSVRDGIRLGLTEGDPDAVPPEDRQRPRAQERHQPAHGDHGGDERDEGADERRSPAVLVEQRVAITGEVVERRGRQRREAQEEAELDRRGHRRADRQRSGDRDERPAGPRPECEDLCGTDDRRLGVMAPPTLRRPRRRSRSRPPPWSTAIRARCAHATSRNWPFASPAR